MPVATRSSPLTRAGIAGAALAILDAEGEEALSMRRLAVDLDCAPMSLYNHVRDKDDLHAEVVDVALADIDVDVPGRRWDTRLLELARRCRQVLLDHPGLHPLMARGVRIGPSTLRIQEAVLAALTDAGLRRAAIAPAFFSFIAITTSPTFSGALSSGGQWLDGASLAELAGDDLPRTRELADALSAADADAAFEFAVQAYVAGLRRLAGG